MCMEGTCKKPLDANVYWINSITNVRADGTNHFSSTNKCFTSSGWLSGFLQRQVL